MEKSVLKVELSEHGSLEEWAAKACRVAARDWRGSAILPLPMHGPD